jgi:hypothetical protein
MQKAATPKSITLMAMSHGHDIWFVSEHTSNVQYAPSYTGAYRRSRLQYMKQLKLISFTAL